MASICTKVSAVLHIDFVPPVQCQQCKCQYSKKGKKKKKKSYYYCENNFDLMDSLKGSREPPESMGHTLRTSNYYNIASDGKQE